MMNHWSMSCSWRIWIGLPWTTNGFHFTKMIIFYPETATLGIFGGGQFPGYLHVRGRCTTCAEHNWKMTYNSQSRAMRSRQLLLDVGHSTQRIPNRFALAARKSSREQKAWHDDGSLFEGTAFRNTYPLYCPPDPTGSMLDLLRLGF